MSRTDTIYTETWRVHVIAPDGRVERSTQCVGPTAEKTARDYFDALCIPGSWRQLQVRRAGKHRYVVVESNLMR